MNITINVSLCIELNSLNWKQFQRLCICDQKKTSSQEQGECTVHVVLFSLIFLKESALPSFSLKLQVQEEGLLSPMVSIVLL